MSWNAVAGYVSPNLRELAEAGGITQFVGSAGWYQTVNGILLQGGTTEVLPFGVPAIIPFTVPFTKQLFCVLLQPIDQSVGFQVSSAGTDLTQFTMQHTVANAAFYWVALGV